MNNKLYTFLFAFILITGLQACKKGSDDPVIPSGKQILLVDNKWKATEVLSSNNLDITAEFTAYRITFEDTDGVKRFTLINAQGVTQPGTWTISEDEKTISLNFADGSTQTLSSVTIDPGKLKYTTQQESKVGTLDLFFTLVPTF